MVFRISGVAVFLLAASAAMAESPTTIAGEYVEARSNHVYTCGCLYSGEMVTGGREAILAWSFDGGSYQGTTLGGVKALAVLSAEENLSIQGLPRQAVLYLDGITSDTQRDAVVSLLKQRYSGAVGEIIAVKLAPIVFHRLPGSVDVEVPGIARVKARTAVLPQDAHLGASRWYEPFIPLTEATLATTSLYDYEGGDFSKQWEDPDAGITGYFGRFSLSP
jgi:hypothetical protein